MSIPYIRPSITSTQHQPSNTGSLTLLPSFFPKHINRSTYSDSDSKSFKMIELIEPDLTSYPSTKKVKTNVEISCSANTPSQSDFRSKEPIILCYPESERKILQQHHSNFKPTITRQVTLEIISLEGSEAEDDSDCVILDAPIKYPNIQDTQIIENNEVISMCTSPQIEILGSKSVESPVKSQTSSSSPFYSPTSHEFLGEIYGNLEEEPIFPRVCSLNAKRLFQYSEDLELPKEESLEKINLERGDTIIISDCESENGAANYVDNEQTRCTVYDLENHNTDIIDAKDKQLPEEGEETAEGLNTPLTTFTPEEIRIEIKIKPGRGRKPAKKNQGKQKKPAKESTKAQKDSNPPAQKKPRKPREVSQLTQNTDSTYWKGGRGLNKLQVFGYQMGVVINEEETFEKMPFFESDNKDSKNTKDDQEEMNPQETPLNVEPAIIPPLDRRQNDKKRAPLVPKWDPESLKEGELKSFLDKLKELLKDNLIDDERAIGVLKTFDLKSKLALEDVKKNIKYYKEILAQRFRRSRRRVL